MSKNKNQSWLENAIFYQIYPQSFFDTNADGIGDIKGIIEKLDYIKDLGCTAIWINPCFKSPFGDAGYDVEDYYTVAPRYGTNEDLVHLFEEVHKKNMHIILDLVPGHTAITCKWFIESQKAEKNAYTNRYIWTDSVWKTPKNMECIRGISERDGSCVVNFFSHQPALNYGFYKPDPDEKWQQSMDSEGAKSTLEELKNIMRFWLSLGCDGFRVDMASSLVKNDDDKKGTILLWQNVRNFLDKEFPNAVIVSEWGEPDKSLEGGFHMDFLLHFGPSHYNDLFRCENPYFSKTGKGSAKEFIETYKNNYQKTSGKGLICIPSGNHDMDRLSRNLSVSELKIAFSFLLSMPGIPFIYYGDEIGMHYVENLTSVEGGYGRTGSRTPMQWNSKINAGFSTASSEKLYIPIDSDKNRPNVENQLKNEDSLLNEVKELISFRKNHPAMQSSSSINFLNDDYPLVYERFCDSEKILVIINPSDKERSVPYQNEIFCKNEGSVPYQNEKILYKIGGNAKFSKTHIIIEGETSVFIKI